MLDCVALLLEVAHNLQNRSRPLKCALQYVSYTKSANLLVWRKTDVVVVVVAVVAAPVSTVVIVIVVLVQAKLQPITTQRSRAASNVALVRFKLQTLSFDFELAAFIFDDSISQQTILQQLLVTSSSYMVRNLRAQPKLNRNRHRNRDRDRNRKQTGDSRKRRELEERKIDFTPSKP